MKRDKKPWENRADKMEPLEKVKPFSTMSPDDEKEPRAKSWGDKPRQNRPSSGKPPERKTWSEKPPERKAWGDKPQASRPSDNRPSEGRPPERKTWGDKPPERKTWGERPQTGRSSDNRPTEGRPPERKAWSDKPPEKKTWGEKPRVSYPVRVQPKKKIKQVQKPFVKTVTDEEKALPDKTDWQDVAGWYNNLVGAGGSEYHQKVLLPGVERMLKEKNQQLADLKILDLACGQGVLSRRLAAAGAIVTGVDLAKDLLEAAKEYVREGQKRPNYIQGDATDLIDESGKPRHGLEAESFDAVTLVLSIQNMDHLTGVWQGINKLLKPNGVLILVMMHPCFRVPQRSDWQWQQRDFRQTRIMWRYLGSEDIRIAAHPGKEAVGEKSPATIHFHRPLQAYINTLGNAGLLIEHCEEWISHKKEQQGPKKEAMDLARQEFPMFMALRCRKVAEMEQDPFIPSLQEALSVTDALEGSLSTGGNLLANGIDVVSVPRVEAAIERLGENYIKQMLTATEWQVWQDQGFGLSAERLAGRWAAKEAVAKALGTGFVGGITWKNIEIQHNEMGAPQVLLNGYAAQLAVEKGIMRWLISISHDKVTAVALAQALGE